MKHELCVFSKHFSRLPVPEMARAAKEAGFDGIDLAVRPGGHVEPASVETDLPKAVEAIHDAGLSCPMMVSGVTSAEAPDSEAVIRVAAACGIRYYRFGYLSYGDSIQAGLEEHRATLARLAELNEKYRIHGAYQNHAGSRVGGPVWDIWELIRDLDSRWIGCQYDVRHAVIEGGSSWELGMRLLADRIRCVVVKDGKWTETESGRFAATSTPIGSGMVDWNRFREILSETAFEGAVSVHYEYPLFSEDETSLTPADWIKKTVAGMAADLDRARAMFG